MEIVTFSDQQPGYHVEIPSSTDQLFDMADQGDDALENFFERPIKLGSYAWGIGTNFYESLNVWKLFFENPRVINRISNYALLRATLNIKIVVNGNGFHYGRLLANYTPLSGFDDFLQDRALISADNVEASQRPHIFIDPTTSQGGTMTLPFLYFKNAVSIPYAEYDQLGTLTIREIQGLKHANGATDEAVVTVFAWATDVQLSTPTSVNPSALVPQFGEYVPQADEYEKKPVSTALNAVSSAAKPLASLPVIGPYARATQKVASVASNVANVLGYSRPNELSNIQPYKPTVLGDFATTNTPDPSRKLTLDVKQELPLDTRAFGLDGTDELAITNITSRQSWLTSFAWPVNAAPPETLLWNSYVTPALFNKTGNEFHLTSTAFASQFFHYWTGTMKFRFQVVASAYHKGRLKIVWDPVSHASTEYNTAYTHIVDIAENRDFTIEIGWGQPLAYLNRSNYLLESGNYFGTTPLLADAGARMNGILAVYVVNDLTVPNSTINNDIEVNVFVSGGDDLEFAAPSSIGSTIDRPSYYVPQSGEYEMPDSFNQDNENEPGAQEPEMVLGGVKKDQIQQVYFSDPCTSFRQLLKRYMRYDTTLVKGDLIDRLFKYYHPRWPLDHGYAPASAAMHSAATPVDPTPYNFVENCHLSTLRRAFVCERGSIRWKVQWVPQEPPNGYASTHNGHAYGPMVVAHTYGFVNPNSSYGDESGTNASEISRATALHRPYLFSGSQATDVRINPVLEFEVPYYEPHRFTPARYATPQNYSNGFQLTLPTTGSRCYLNWYLAAGEDYQLGFYLCPPIMYAQADPVASPI